MLLNIYDLLLPPLKLDTSKPIRLFEAFSGIGTQHMALKRLSEKYNFTLDVIGISEIDRFAIKSYNAIHGKVKNYGDISKLKTLPNNIDICTWSFPCQDLSVAGAGRGMVDGSRSNYGFDFLDVVERTHTQPKVLIMENVPALIHLNHIKDWHKILEKLTAMNYHTYFQIVRSDDYNIPQTRRRLFAISVKGEYSYSFPIKVPLKRYLGDFLESNVASKYFLSKRFINNMYNTTFNSLKIENRLMNKNSIDPTITARFDGAPLVIYDTPPYILYPENTLSGFKNAYENDGVYLDRPYQKRGTVQRGKIPTIKTSSNDVGVVTPDMRLRKLTPLETWRLMGIDDEDFYKAKASGMSDSQLYKQAGNAIVVDVLYYIFKQFIKE